MSVTEVLMGAGSWGLNWRTDKQGRPTIPFSIRSQILPNDHIVIGPRGLVETLDNHADRLAAVKAARGYRGRIVAYDDTTLSGHGLASWLGYPTGEGPWKDTRTKRTSSTPSTWLDQFLPINGITKGTVSGGTSFAGTAKPFYPTLAYVNWVAENADTEWYINADGTLDMAPSTTLFPTPSATDATVITRKPSGDEGGLSGVEAVDLAKARDSSGVISRAVVFHSASPHQATFATSTQTPSGVRWKDAAGNTPTAWSRAFVAPREGADVADAFADRAIARSSVAPVEVTLTSRTHNVTAEVRPGDRVWVYDVDSGLTNSANQVTWQGEVITPLQMRVNALTWPITGDLGVYLVLDGDDWYDVTEYVQVEDPFVSWDVTISGRKINRSPITEDLVTFGPAARSARSMLMGSAQSNSDELWLPTVANVTLGTGGSSVFNYTFNEYSGHFYGDGAIALGTSGNVTGTPTFDLPDDLEFWGVYGDIPLGMVYVIQSDFVPRFGIVRRNTSGGNSSMILQIFNASSTYLQRTAFSSSVPTSWTSGDQIWFSFNAWCRR